MALSDNLVAYYSLEEASGNAIDAHGSNDLTETSGTIASATGKVGNCRDCEAGDTAYFTIADNADVSTGDISYTLCCWAKFETVVNAMRIISKGNTAVTVLEHSLWYRSGSGSLVFDIYDGSSGLNGRAVANIGAPAADTWYFIVCRHNATANTIRISVNDSDVSAATTGAGVDTASPFNIGSLEATAGTFFDGLIDEVGFWKRELSDAEVTDLYNSGNGRDYAYIVGGAATPLAPPVFRRRRMFR